MTITIAELFAASQKRALLKIMAGVCCLFSIYVESCAAALQNAARPNFVIILADDLGYGDVGFTGSTQIRAPQIDALARAGVIFEQGYVSAPQVLYLEGSRYRRVQVDQYDQAYQLVQPR